MKQYPRLGQPTTAHPGSKEKVTALIRRYEFGLALFHPEDEPVIGHSAYRLGRQYDQVGEKLSYRMLHSCSVCFDDC